MADKFYITTSIAYVNGKPHIGFAMEVIQADVVARFRRLKGDDVHYQTGTDEHGMKLVQTAKEQGITPQELADKNAEKYKALKELLNLDFDYFIRTTDDYHKKAAQKLWGKLVESDDIYTNSYEGLYCVGCEAFVLEKDLVEGKCPNHGKEPEKLKEENFFFKLSKYNDQIHSLIESDELKIIPESRKHEILALTKEGLKDVSFSRPKSVLPWGVTVPGHEDQVMYVWCDALSNYITGVGYLDEDEQFKKYWPCDLHLIGKDILRFHAAIWIGMLISAGVDLPKSIAVHGFITSEGKKMSKTMNNVVDPAQYTEKYGIDPLRYYLLKEIPTTGDGDFSKERFHSLYDSDLAHNIGNLVSRVLSMNEKYFDAKVPDTDKSEGEFAEKLSGIWKTYEEAIDEFDLRKGLEQASTLADFANKYIDDTKPWELAKNDEEDLKKVMYVLLEILRHIALLLLPYLPGTAEEILRRLGSEAKGDFEKLTSWGILEAGTKTEKGEPLFKPVEFE
ncbi:methionine--tRNA ligase [Pseudomonadota bacterium]